MKVQEETQTVRFKQPVLVCAAALLAVASLQAAPMAPSCATAATFADLAADGSCALGDKLYSNFLFASTAINTPNVPENQVAIVSTSATTAQNGFEFSLPLSAGVNQVSDVSMSYTVTDMGQTPITSVDVPTFVGSTQGGAVAVLSETVTGPSGVLGALTISPSSPSGSLTFGGVTSITIAKDLVTSGGVVSGGLGSISLFTDYVDQTAVPEPGFYGVLAGGMVVVLMFCRRRKKTA